MNQYKAIRIQKSDYSKIQPDGKTEYGIKTKDNKIFYFTNFTIKNDSIRIYDPHEYYGPQKVITYNLNEIVTFEKVKPDKKKTIIVLSVVTAIVTGLAIFIGSMAKMAGSLE